MDTQPEPVSGVVSASDAIERDLEAELVPAGPQQPQGLTEVLGATPETVLQRTAEVAKQYKEFLRQQGLVKRIGQSDHISVDGWQMLGMMLGCTAVVTQTRQTDNGWEAKAELRDRTGRVIGAGDAECLRDEKRWKQADDYAIRSMAQTRAIGKAFRSVFGFIAKSAGFEATPAEEMDGVKRQPAKKPPALSRRQKAGNALNAGPRTVDELVEMLEVESADQITGALEGLSDKVFEALLLWLAGQDQA